MSSPTLTRATRSPSAWSSSSPPRPSSTHSCSVGRRGGRDEEALHHEIGLDFPRDAVLLRAATCYAAVQPGGGRGTLRIRGLQVHPRRSDVPPEHSLLVRDGARDHRRLARAARPDGLLGTPQDAAASTGSRLRLDT